MNNIFLEHLEVCPQKEKCVKHIAFNNVNFLIDQEILSLDSCLKNLDNQLENENFEEYYNQRWEKRADHADFFLDMIMEKQLIKLDKSSIRKYFIKWFKETQEFDLQIKNGDLVIEDGDFQMIPEFTKDNIPQFLKWFENEGNKFIDYLKGQGMNVKENSKEAIINTGNLIINENSKIKGQTIINGKEQKESSWTKANVIIAVIACVATVISMILAIVG